MLWTAQRTESFSGAVQGHVPFIAVVYQSSITESSLSCCHIDKSPRVYQEAPARPQFQHRPSSCWLRLHLYETGTRRVTHPYARGMLPTTQEPPLSSVTDWSDLSDEHRLVRTRFVQNATTITLKGSQLTLCTTLLCGGISTLAFASRLLSLTRHLCLSCCLLRWFRTNNSMIAGGTRFR